MRKLVTIFTLVLGTLFLADSADAQVLPLSFEVRAGAAIPTGDFDDVSTGFTYGANIAWHFTPMFGVYGGYTQANFSGDNGNDPSLENFDVGAIVDLPFPALSPWVRGGLVFGQYDGASRGTGFEAGGGIGFNVTPMISITPGVRFTTIPVGDDHPRNVTGNATYITTDVGVRVRI